MPRPKKILITGGGTGGHVFPAIAIADTLRRKLSDTDILFIGARGKLEMEKVPLAGYPVKGLWISGFQRRLTLRNLLFPLKVAVSLLQADLIIRKFKPDVVIGVGGYASGPTVKMAARRKIPVVLQEQNSFPGITNRWLAKVADVICVAYEGMEKYFPKEKIVITGNPVRQNVIDIADKRKPALEYFELDKNKLVILVIGGSQGARSINESVDKNLELLAMSDLQVIWQTGRFYTERAQKAILEKLNGNKKNNVRVKEFISRMDYAYATADIVISRAGAIAISELSAVGKPCIFIPLPSAAEDHQTRNATALAEKDAAIHLKDSESTEKLGKIVLGLARNQEHRERLSENIRKMAVADAADRIAVEVLKLIEDKDES